VLRTFAREEGFALPAAMAALAIILLIGAVATTSAVTVGATTDKDRDSKRALAAAEAGLESAGYRLNKLNASSASCVTDEAVPRQSDGTCPTFSEDAGNGTSYTYHVSPPLQDGASCAGAAVSLFENGVQTVQQRCVTSMGEVNGVKRRTQARVASYVGAPLWPLPGFVGKRGVSSMNGLDVYGGKVGSNGQISTGNESDSSLVLSPTAPDPVVGPNSDVTWERRTQDQGPFVLGDVDLGNSPDVNENARIADGSDARSGSVSYNSLNHELTVAQNANLTLSGGDTGVYHFCSVILGNNATITIPFGARIKIYLDDPDRPGSPCRPRAQNPDAGDIRIGLGSAKFATVSGEPLDLQIYAWGSNAAAIGPQDPSASNIDFNNDDRFVGVIYAPRSRVYFKNVANVTGGIAADFLDFKNAANMTYDADISELGVRTVLVHYRTAWRECPSVPSDSGNLSSGC
jgi:type II secretory pathway pseudopilin PulG